MRRLRRLKSDKRGISNVLVVMLSLVLVTVIVANVVLWSYQMNQYDWEKTQEKPEITYVGDKSPWFTSNTEYILENGSLISGTHEDTWDAKDDAYETFTEELNSYYASTLSWPSDYTLLNLTRRTSGSLTDLQNNDGSYMIFESYASESVAYTFGNTNAGGSYTSVTANRMYGSLFTSPSAVVTAKSISFYGRSTSGTRNVKCLIVRHSDLQIIAITDPVSISTTLQWWTASFSSPPTLSPNMEYILMVIPNNQIRFYYTAGTANQGHYDTTNDYNSPMHPTDAQHSSLQYSIYCSCEQVLEQKVEVEFKGTAEIDSWSQLILTIDSSSTINSVNAIFQLYDYQADRYSEIGEDGYISAVLGTVDSLLTHAITSNPTCFIHPTSGEWKLKVICVKSASEPFYWKADLVELKFITQNATDFALSVIGEFVLDIDEYFPDYVRRLEISIRIRASDTLEDWILKAYNQDGQYVDIGGPFKLKTSFETYLINLTDAWQSYVNDGKIMLKLCDAGPDADQTTVDIDFFGVRFALNGTLFTIKNAGTSTIHIVSIWVINATHHKRYNADFFINSGDTASKIRDDITLPSGKFVVKVVTDRGNMAVFVSD